MVFKESLNRTSAIAEGIPSERTPVLLSAAQLRGCEWFNRLLLSENEAQSLDLYGNETCADVVDRAYLWWVKQQLLACCKALILPCSLQAESKRRICSVYFSLRLALSICVVWSYLSGAIQFPSWQVDDDDQPMTVLHQAHICWTGAPMCAGMSHGTLHRERIEPNLLTIHFSTIKKLVGDH
jgi:hypothetical protein